MPLSDKEIKELLEKAGRFRIVEGNDLPCLKEALNCYNQVIENAPAHPHYFSERAEIKYRLFRRSGEDDLLNSAIEDINRALQLDPDTGRHYGSRGVYLWEKLERENLSDKKTQHSKGECLCELGRYDEALACYDKVIELRPDWGFAKSNRERLFAKLNPSAGGQ